MEGLDLRDFIHHVSGETPMFEVRLLTSKREFNSFRDELS